MLRRVLAVLLLGTLVLAGLAASPARAEHTPHHRYFFVGAVQSESGQPVCGITVRAYEANSAGSEGRDRSAATDLFGRYSIQLHLHSGEEPEAQPPDVNVQVNVTVAGLFRVVTVVGNSLNSNGWGQLTIDFTVPDSVSSPGLCIREVAIYGGAGGGVGALVIGGVWYMRRPHRSSGRVRREVMDLPGVTRAKARELDKAGIRTLEALADADADEIAGATTLTAKQARLLVKRAREERKQRNA